MGFDIGQINQLLSHIPYPISYADLIQFARQHGANDQILGILERLPDQIFHSPENIKNTFNNLRNLGHLGGFKL